MFPSIFPHQLDINEVAPIAQSEGIQAMPTFKFYRGGRSDDSLIVVGATVAKVEDSLRRLSSMV